MGHLSLTPFDNRDPPLVGPKGARSESPFAHGIQVYTGAADAMSQGWACSWAAFTYAASKHVGVVDPAGNVTPARRQPWRWNRWIWDRRNLADIYGASHLACQSQSVPELDMVSGGSITGWDPCHGKKRLIRSAHSTRCFQWADQQPLSD